MNNRHSEIRRATAHLEEVTMKYNLAWKIRIANCTENNSMYFRTVVLTEDYNKEICFWEGYISACRHLGR